MKIRKNRLAVCTAAMLIACVSATFGYFSDIVTVTNHIATGDVNISLKEYEVKEGTEISYTNSRIVLPGDVISKIPRITNHAMPCWIRARISYEQDKEELEGLSESNILGVPAQWVKKGEYYYYTEILDYGKSATLFEAVEIPKEWNESHSDQKLTIDIQADAIQAANFEPDFNAMSPWGDQEIELCIHEENGTVVSEKKKVELSVEFSGNAHKLLAVPDDFFANFRTVMPGDTFRDSIDILNTTKKPAEIFFHTGIVCQREDRMDLLRKIQLTISMNGKAIYSGNLLAEELKEEVSLGVFQPGEGGTMEFTVSVPAELKNAYALRDAAVKWYFSVYEDDAEPSVIPEENRVQTSGSSGYRNGTDTAEPVKTADETPLLSLLVMAIISMLTGTTVLIIRKGDVRQ